MKRYWFPVLGILVVFLVIGCKLTITSFTAPDSAESGEIITLKVTGDATDGDNATEYGIVLQIPENWEVISTTTNICNPVLNTCYDLDENQYYSALYTPEPMYKIWIGTQSWTGISGGRHITSTIKILTTPFDGTYGNSKNFTLKAIAGVYRDGAWQTDDPAGVFNFSALTSDKYVETINVTKVNDITPPAQIPLTYTDFYNGTDIRFDWSAYDENAQKDVMEYRIYQSTSYFTNVSGMSYIKKTFGTYTHEISGLTPGQTYYFAVTAVDEVSNENKNVTPISVTPRLISGSIEGTAFEYQSCGSSAVCAVNVQDSTITAKNTQYENIILSSLSDSSVHPEYNYFIENIPIGNYEVTVEKEGYESKFYTVDIYENTTASVPDEDLVKKGVISGYIRDENGVGVSGVLMTYCEGFPPTCNHFHSDNNGYYSVFVPLDWTGTLAPKFGFYVFEPVERSYNNVTGIIADQNYIATPPNDPKYFVSGYVRYPDDLGAISGVKVNYYGNHIGFESGYVMTDESGYYRFPVSEGWYGQIIPSMTCYDLSPMQIVAPAVYSDYTDQNFTGVISSYTISGYIRDSSGSAGISNVTLSFSNGGGTTATNDSGYYSKTLPCGWNGTVTSSINGYSISPASKEFTLESNLINQNFTATYTASPQIKTDPTSLTIVQSAYTTKRIVTFDKSSAREAVTRGAEPQKLFHDPAAEQISQLTAEQTRLLEQYDSEETTIESRLVTVNTGLLTDSDAVNLNLFADTDFLTFRSRIEERGENNFSWFGVIENADFGNAVFVLRDNQLTGTVNTGEKLFAIISLGADIHILIRQDAGQFPPDGPSEYVTEEAPISLLGRAGGSDDGSEITVMVAYTQAASDASGDIESLIQLAVDTSNLSYQNSNIIPRLRLVHTYQTDYIETLDMPTDLNRLKATDDGFADEIHQIRNNYMTDIVVLLVINENSCGRGFVNTSLNPDLGFAVVNVKYNCPAGNYSFAHEIGHIQNAQHNPEAEPLTVPFSYGHGYLNTEDSWRTIMAYDNTECANGRCARIPYWSNPYVTYGEDPMGTSSTHNNARVLNQTAVAIANFRVTAPDSSFTIQNTGNASLTISSISKTQKWLTLSDFSTPLTIPVDGSQKVNADVNWDLVSYTLKDAITISSNDPNNPSVTIPVKLVESSADEFDFPYLSVMPEEREIPSSEGTDTFIIDNIGTGTMGWSAYTYDPWLEILSGSPGSNNGTVTFHYDANSGGARSGHIIIAAPTAENSPLTVKIKQEKGVEKGDVNNSGSTDLTDAVLALQVCAGMNVSGIRYEADINNDDKIGIPEAVYALQKVAELRE